MNVINKEGRLITIRPGQYVKNGSGKAMIQYHKPKQALLLKQFSENKKTAWLCLVDGDLIIVWEDAISKDTK